MALDKESKTLGKKRGISENMFFFREIRHALTAWQNIWTMQSSLQITANTEPLPVIIRESGFL